MRRALCLLLLVGAALAASAGTAGAHSTDGALGIEVTAGSAPLTARVRVLLEYANDREVAPGATVVAQASGPGGQSVGATPLSDLGQGNYEATLTMPAPGSWTVTVTATNPAASAQGTVVVSAAASPTTAPTARTTAASSDVATSSDRTRKDSGASGDGSDGPSAPLIVGIAVVLGTAVAVGAVVVRRRTHT